MHTARSPGLKDVVLGRNSSKQVLPARLFASMCVRMSCKVAREQKTGLLAWWHQICQVMSGAGLFADKTTRVSPGALLSRRRDGVSCTAVLAPSVC